ncbi:hypothetical protein [Vallitalea sediminicola]
MKLRKGDNVKTDIIVKICTTFQCVIYNILEIVLAKKKEEIQ